MSWIKRNLFFVIGSLIALGLLAWAGFYNISRLKLNADSREKLNEQYKELTRLSNQNPHPGNAKVDNIAAARTQREMLTNVIVRADKLFQPIPTVPSPDRLTSQDFAAALGQTIDQLRRDALNMSVVLPPQYSFSFTVERTVLNFTAGSLVPLSVQLGEVRAICNIFNNAKVNTLDNIRRERVCQEDMSGAQAQATDYLDILSRTNDLAVFSPYEISFRCFTPELANLLAQFASSPNGFVVRSIYVESAPAATTTGDTSVPPPIYVPQAAPPPRMAGPSGPLFRPNIPRFDESDSPGRRPQSAAPAPTPAASRGGLQTFITERQLRVTMLIEVVKLLPKK